MTQSVSNVESGDNFIRTAEGGLAVVSKLVNRVRQLAIQCSNGTLNDSQRETLSQELSQVHKEIDRLTGSLQFNDQNLLDGALRQNTNPLNIQAGAESEPENQMSLNLVESTSAQSLGVDNADISTAQGALQAVDDFEQASQSLNAARGQVGAVGNPWSAPLTV
jgi:flagellin